MSITKERLTEFLKSKIQDKKSAEDYPVPTTGRLIPATLADVTNPDKKLYIVDMPIYGSMEKFEIYIPLKFNRENYDEIAKVNVYSYDLYKANFSTKEHKEIYTRKTTIEEKIKSKNIFVHDSTLIPTSFIFDFDCTLTVCHLFYFLNSMITFYPLYNE